MDAARILIVEDHAPLREIIADILSEAGYTVITAEDGQAALHIMQQQRPDLIVADIMMPRMDGYEFYTTVRESPQWVTIPFIFLTAKAEREDVLHGKMLGAEEYLTKPLDSKTLVVAVQSRLQRAQTIQNNFEANFERLKENIVVLLSHELRTPLTYVRGYTEMALEDVTTLSPAQTQHFLSRIKHGANRLSDIVEDLLVLVELDSGIKYLECQKKLQVHDQIGLAIQLLVDAQQEAAASQQVLLESVIPDTLPPVTVCLDFLSIAINQLLDNAIKFSARKPGGQVRVTASADSEWLDIAISDNGIGISADELPHLFRSFYQVDREHLEQQGAGLGLAVAAGLIRVQGGRIATSSQPGTGSTFTIQLPLQRPSG